LRPSAILYVLKFEILTAGTVSKVNMRRHANLRSDRSNHCCIILI